MSDDERPAKRTCRGRYQDDVDLDAYIDHLRSHGGPTRASGHHLLTTTLAQLLWYGDLPKEEIRNLRRHRTLYFPLNTDNPVAASRTGGSHWFLVVLTRSPSPSMGTYWVLIIDSAAKSHTRRLPHNEHTERNLRWLTGRETAEICVRNVTCPQQTETECGLCTLSNIEVLYRWQDWDPDTVELKERSCPVDRLRDAHIRFLKFIADRRRRQGAVEEGGGGGGWFFTDDLTKEEKSTRKCQSNHTP